MCGDKGAAALPGFDDSIAGQQVDRLADGDTGDAEFCSEFFIRWQPQALRPYSSGNTLAKDVSDLGVFRTWLSEIKSISRSRLSNSAVQAAWPALMT